MIVSPEQLSEVVSAAQMYDRPVVGSSYSSMFLVPKAHMKYRLSQIPTVVSTWRVWRVLQLLS